MQKFSLISILGLSLVVIIVAVVVSYLTTLYLVEKHLYQIAVDADSVSTQATDRDSIGTMSEPQIDWDQQVQNYNRAIESDPELASRHQVLYEQRSALYAEIEQYDDITDVPEALQLEYQRISDEMLGLLQRTPGGQ